VVLLLCGLGIDHHAAGGNWIYRDASALQLLKSRPHSRVESVVEVLDLEGIRFWWDPLDGQDNTQYGSFSFPIVRRQRIGQHARLSHLYVNTAETAFDI
jgi:hypothetical protein